MLKFICQYLIDLFMKKNIEMMQLHNYLIFRLNQHFDFCKTLVHHSIYLYLFHIFTTIHFSKASLLSIAQLILSSRLLLKAILLAEIFKVFIFLSLDFHTLFYISLSLTKVQLHQIYNYFLILIALYLNYYLKMESLNQIIFLEFNLFKKNKYFVFVLILNEFEYNYYLTTYILIFHLFFFVFRVDPLIFCLVALMFFKLLNFLILKKT